MWIDRGSMTSHWFVSFLVGSLAQCQIMEFYINCDARNVRKETVYIELCVTRGNVELDNVYKLVCVLSVFKSC